MFDSDMHYATAKIVETLDASTQNLLWLMIDSMDVGSKDRLQAFELSACSYSRQKIVHTQRQPAYHNEVVISGINPVTATVFVLDNGQHTTMLLSDEYQEEGK